MPVMTGGNKHNIPCYSFAMDKTALIITVIIAASAALLVILRLYFGGQMDHWFS
jgi:hypothetical protein